MDPSRWQSINRIFHAALELPPGDRGAFVVAESDGDPALRCEVERLLSADEAAASSYLESPLIEPSALREALRSQPGLQPGTLLGGRFRILRLVGEGGMGQVYEARDEELGVAVALKVIRPEIASHPEAVALFRQEVRLARRITHPNICRIYEFNREMLVHPDSTSGELLYLTMEFLAGETLADRIRRLGAMPPAAALPIARQIAAGLDAAHALGVVHRDIKPSNIHMVPDPRDSEAAARIVITDFGLARQDPIHTDADPSASSGHARPIGTLGYMAPEQMENGPVSAATDIYAFGLVLFEMVSGARAFPPSRAQQLNGTSPLPEPASAHLPEEWQTAVQRCLRLAPSDRPQTAADVIAILEGSASASPVLPPPSKQTHRSSRWRSASAAVALLLSLLAAGYRYYQVKTHSSVAAGALVYVAPLRNNTGDRSMDTLDALIEAGVAQSPRIRLLDESRAGDILQQMTKPPESAIDPLTAREIAMRSGAARVVFPTLSRSGAAYRLDIDIQQPGTTPAAYRDRWSKTFVWQEPSSTSGQIPKELLAAVQDSSNWIRREVGESAKDLARLNVPPEDVTTGSWTALSAYIHAQDLQSREATSQAVVALQQAVALDPDFATAWGRLGDLLVATGRYREGYAAYRHALDVSQERRLTRKERDRIEGEYAFDSFDFAASEAAYRDYAEYYRNDYLAWNFRGYPLLLLGRTGEAISTLQRAYSIDPSRGNAPWELGRASIARADFPQVLRWAAVLRRQGDPGTSNYLAGVVHFLNQDYSAALASFTAIQQANRLEDRSWSYSLLARLEAELGNDTAATSYLADGMKFDRKHSYTGRLADKLLAQSYIGVRAGNFDSSLHNLHAALALDDSPERILLASTVLGVAFSRAPASAKSAIRAQLANLDTGITPQATGEITSLVALRVRGELLLADGDWPAALVQFRKAVQIAPPTAGQEYLGRALVLAAQHQPSPRRRELLLRSALKAYGAAVLRPNLIWIQPGLPLPGIYRDQLIAYCDTAAALHLTDDNTKAALQALLSLEGHPSAGINAPSPPASRQGRAPH